MGEVSQISEFGKILIFLIVGVVALLLIFFASRLIAPKNPTPEKLTSYECGEEPTGDSWVPFNPRFYVIALVFLLFDVEMVFVFPWATVFGSKDIINVDGRWGVLSLIEMFAFLVILILGLVYVWVKGDLNWIKPEPVKPRVNLKTIPADVYQQVNQAQSAFKIKTFSTEPQAVEVDATAATAAPAEAGARKPMFKPSFKKPASDE